MSPPQSKLGSRTRKSKAWLLVWIWSGPHAALEDEVAAILPSRWRTDRVEQAMWLLFQLREHNLAGLADVARNARNGTYQAQWHNGVAHMGGSPSLSAFQVQDLEVATDPASGLETLRYTMLTLYKEKTGVWPPEAAVVRGPLPLSILRKRLGALSARRLP